ncbi:MAG TPA: PAS domain-containing protein [Oscillospiraceae bacterium]|nr:PAS domain-containing protein [Oscillospiraceae bacterium]HRW57045.1 PAS domain-containing protein [Oscillospiraceae bacterium]
MQSVKIALTQNDQDLLQTYAATMDGLADYLGLSYEIVLHSLNDLEHSAIKVINGYHTGRTQGAPITDLALEMLEKISRNDQKDSICYRTVNKYGDPLWSTTIAIRGSENRVIGLLCINQNLNTPVSRLFPGISFPSEEAYVSAQKKETYVEDVDDMVSQAVDEAVRDVADMANTLPSARNREIVRKLYHCGVFSMKDAVVLVAEKLDVSKNTVYLHLRRIKSEETLKH